MNAAATNASADDRVARALALVGSLTPPQAAARLGEAGVVVIDVRDAADWAAAHIPGAVNAPRGMLEFHIDPASSFHLPVFDPQAGRAYLFCCGSGARAALSARLAREMGLANATCIAGGMRDWRAAGLPLASASDSSSPSP